MKTLNGFILLTATAIEKKCNATFPWQQWLCEHATMLHYTYTAYGVLFFFFHDTVSNQTMKHQIIG
jgi:hypothetical protein